MRTNLHVKFICASGFPAGNANGHHKKHVFDSPSIRTIQVTWMDKCHFVTQNTGLDNREKNLLCIWTFSDRAAGVNPVLTRRRPRCRVHSHKWTVSSASGQATAGRSLFLRKYLLQQHHQHSQGNVTDLANMTSLQRFGEMTPQSYVEHLPYC